MMKKVIMMGFLFFLLVSSVSAANIIKRTYKMTTEGVSHVKVEEHIQEDKPDCGGNQVHSSEVSQLNKEQYFQEALEYFDDGYHVIELTEAEYQGYKYYTVFKDDNKIRNIRQGFCAEGDYHGYQFDLDLQTTLNQLDQDYANGELNPISEGLHIIRNIKGVSLYQKTKLIALGTQYVKERWQNGQD